MVVFGGTNCQTDPFPEIYVPTWYCFSSAPTQWFFSCEVHLLIPHCCYYEFNHQSFPLKKQISYQLSLLISHRKKLNKTNQPNKQKKQSHHISHPGESLRCFMAPGWFPTHSTVCLQLWYVRNFKLASSLKHFNDLISKARAALFVQHQFVNKVDLWERHSQTRHWGH